MMLGLSWYPPKSNPVISVTDFRTVIFQDDQSCNQVYAAFLRIAVNTRRGNANHLLAQVFLLFLVQLRQVNSGLSNYALVATKRGIYSAGIEPASSKRPPDQST
jgi:hypothetical protein